MASRYSKAYNIKKDEIGSLVTLKHHHGVAEWWINRKKESRFVDTQGKKLRDNETYLYCIILADIESSGKRQENEECIAIEGVKVTNDEHGNNLQEYLTNSRS